MGPHPVRPGVCWYTLPPAEARPALCMVACMIMLALWGSLPSQCPLCHTEECCLSRLEEHRPDLHMVLVSPQIPENTGSIARTCAATAVGLHLVGPLGYEINSTR